MGLSGRRIAIAGQRRAAELARLIGAWGGQAVHRPVAVTVPVEGAEARERVEGLLAYQPAWVVFTTGDGVRALARMAAAAGQERAFRSLLERARLAARGYKTVRALQELGLTPAVRDPDGTVAGLLRALRGFPLAGQRVAVQTYGVPAPELTEGLAALGARVWAVAPYRHVPAPPAALEALIREVVAASVDAVVFTAPFQVRFLFDFAAAQGHRETLRDALAGPVVAAATGAVTAQALRAAGVQRVVVPARERMGAMVAALADHLGGEVRA